MNAMHWNYSASCAVPNIRLEPKASCNTIQYNSHLVYANIQE